MIASRHLLSFALPFVVLLGCAPTYVGWLAGTTADGREVPRTGDSLRILREGKAVGPAESTLEYGDVVETSAEHGTMLAFMRTRVGLRPATRVVVSKARGLTLELERGEAIVAGGDGSVSQVATRELTANFQRDGRLSVRCDAGGTVLTTFARETRIALSGPGAADRAVTLPPYRRLRVDADGAHRIEEATPQEWNEIVRWSNGLETERQRWVLPVVVGMRRDAAEQLLQGSGASATLQHRPAPPDSVDIVLEQRPALGDIAGTVTLWVGATAIQVPDLSGLDAGAAQVELARRKLHAGTVTEELRADDEAQRVLSQAPAAGAQVLEDAAVDYVVSAPARRMPDLVGLSRREVEIRLSRSDLTLGAETTRHSASVAKGRVLSQATAAGALVRRGGAVSVVFSAGTLPAPTLEQPGHRVVVNADARGGVHFEWQDVAHATEYEVVVEHPRDSAALVGHTGTSGFLGKPAWERDWTEAYSWRVRGKADGEWGQWSNTWLFQYEPPDVHLPATETGTDAGALGVALRELGLAPESVEEYSDEVPAGRVVRVEPPAHGRFKPADRVVLVVSKGMRPETRDRLAREEAARRQAEDDARHHAEAAEAARLAADRSAAEAIEAAKAARLAALEPKLEHERSYAAARARIDAGDYHGALPILAQAAADFESDQRGLGNQVRAISGDMIQATWALVAWHVGDLATARVRANPDAPLPAEVRAVLEHIDEQFVAPSEPQDLLRGVRGAALQRAVEERRQERRKEEARLEREFRVRQDAQIRPYFAPTLAAIPPPQLAGPSNLRWEHHVYGSDASGQFVPRAADPSFLRILWDPVPGAIGYRVMVVMTPSEGDWQGKNSLLTTDRLRPDSPDRGLSATFGIAQTAQTRETAATSIDIDVPSRFWGLADRQRSYPMAWFRIAAVYETGMSSLCTPWIWPR